MTERVTIDDIRKAGHCVKGAKAWFERHDLDFRDFLKNGIDVDELLASGDSLAEQVVRSKRERDSAERRDG